MSENAADVCQPERRRLLGAIGAAGLPITWFAAPAAAQSANGLNVLTVLYRRDQDGLPARTDPAPLAAASQLEQEFAGAGFNVRQPDAKAYELLEKGPELIVEFDRDAGATLMFAVSQIQRPHPRNPDWSLVDVRIRGKVHLGPSVLVAGAEASGRGTSVAMAPGAAGLAAAFEKAAQDAATELVGKVAQRLKGLSAQEVTAAQRPLPTVVQGGAVVAAPRPPMPAPVTVSAPSATAPAPGPAPAPAAPSGAPALALQPPQRKYALLVGVSDYSRVNRANAGKVTMGNLAGVAVDMKILRGMLTKRGFSAEDIVMLENERATSANVRAQLMTLAGKAQPDDLVLVAMSAHGAPSAYSLSGYGLPILDDFRLSGQSDANALDFWQIQGLIGHLPARQVVLLADTCHAGGAAIRMPRLTVSASRSLEVRAGNVAPSPEQLAGDITDPRKAYVVVASSQSDEESLEDMPHGGLFTSRMVRAIEAAAGKESLVDVFRQRVQKEVIDASTSMCRNNRCKVQNPVLAYTGLGQQIRI
ncbi:MAG: caspase family protein [Rubrivivax sp.]|nr:caspase family protein [Rubrivivax sp.]